VPVIMVEAACRWYFLIGAETIARRVEQLLAQTWLPRKMRRKAWAAILVCMVPLAAISSEVVAQTPAPKEENKAMTSDRDTMAQRKEEQERPRTEVQIDPKILDNYVGYYQFRQNMIFTITRQGDQLVTQLPGQPPVQVYPESAQKFFAKLVHAQISFVTDPQGRATELVLHQGAASNPRSGSTRRKRTARRSNLQRGSRTERRSRAARPLSALRSKPCSGVSQTTIPCPRRWLWPHASNSPPCSAHSPDWVRCNRSLSEAWAVRAGTSMKPNTRTAFRYGGSSWRRTEKSKGF
jgi:hypothetical protein